MKSAFLCLTQSQKELVGIESPPSGEESSLGVCLIFIS